VLPSMLTSSTVAPVVVTSLPSSNVKPLGVAGQDPTAGPSVVTVGGASYPVRLKPVTGPFLPLEFSRATVVARPWVALVLVDQPPCIMGGLPIAFPVYD
jgi:hypothetical protein